MRRRALLATSGLTVALLAALTLILSGCGSSAPAGGAGVLTGEGTYKGVPVGFTPQGYPYLGRVDAPVTLEEFSDFLCPFCGRHFTQTLPTLIRDYVAKGKVKYVFRDMPLASLHPTSAQGHVAARCVAEQGPQLFWAMHDELFATQDKWHNLSDPADSLEAAAKKAGADVGDYEKCLSAGVQKKWVDESIATGTQKLKFNATPTFQFIQSAALAAKADPKAKGAKVYPLEGAYPVERFTGWLKALAAGKAPPDEEQAQKPTPTKLPYWANKQGLAPDPAKPGFTKAGDPYKGDPGAKIAVIEFSNFQCPHCRTHTLDVEPTLDKKFVDTGKIMWVFKNLPLQSLPQSMDASVAAECAGDQGRFWEMHKALFEKQKSWSVSSPEPVLRGIAGDLGLDVDESSACFNSRKSLEKVLDDMYDARGVVGTTPSFIVISGGKGGVLSGVKAAPEFVKILQGFLDKANGVKPASESNSSQAPSSTP
jgi:protein-disulfide isomerase